VSKYKINQSAGYLDEINHKERGLSVKVTFAEVPKIEEISIAAFILIVGQQLIINAVPVSTLLTSIFFT
jgi:hypothetical protein